MTNLYQWPNTYGFLHFPFLIIEKEGFNKPEWYPGYIEPLLGYSMYSKVFMDRVKLIVYENGLFAFDFSKHPKLKSLRTADDFEANANLMSKRAEYMNAYMACLEMAVLKKLNFSFGAVMIADPNNLISIKGNGYGWGGNFMSIMMEKHGTRLSDLAEPSMPGVMPKHKIDARVLQFSALKFNQILAKIHKFPKVDLIALVESIFRASAYISQHVYDQALVNSWIVIEVSINQLWQEFLTTRNVDGARRETLESSAWSISHKHETLFFNRRLSAELNKQVSLFRSARNRLMHEGTLKDGLKWEESVQLAEKLLKKSFGLDIELPLGRSLHG